MTQNLMDRKAQFEATIFCNKEYIKNANNTITGVKKMLELELKYQTGIIWETEANGKIESLNQIIEDYKQEISKAKAQLKKLEQLEKLEQEIMED